MALRLFVPSSSSSPRLDSADEIRDVIAHVTVVDGRGIATELVVGLDLGRVIRVVALARSVTLPARAQAQLAFHTGKRPRYTIRTDELYFMDVQAVERQPDAPGADDPLFLYGVLRGPYPAALADGVVATEGQLATTRGPLLDGLANGIDRAFVYETGACGASCVHAVLPGDPEDRAVVLAFPLVPMGDDGSNELVAGQLVHDVLGAMRTDLGDDLAGDPVPVPSRRHYERELADAGWTIEGDVAVQRGGRGRFASLFSPGKKQKLPREVALAQYPAIMAPHLARLPGWPEPARSALHLRLGLREPPPQPPPPLPRARPPTQPPPLPRARPPTQPPPLPRARPPTPPIAPPAPRRAPPRTVAPGLAPAVPPKEWIRRLVEDHRSPGRPPPRVTTPARGVGESVPEWMLALIDAEFPDDDK